MKQTVERAVVGGGGGGDEDGATDENLYFRFIRRRRIT